MTQETFLRAWRSIGRFEGRIEGLSTSDAAEIMELGEAAFKSRLHRARLAVRRAVDEHLAGVAE